MVAIITHTDDRNLGLLNERNQLLKQNTPNVRHIIPREQLKQELNLPASVARPREIGI